MSTVLASKPSSVKRAPRAARTSRKATLTAVDSVIDSKPKKIADLIGVNIKVKGGTKSSDLRVTLGNDPEVMIQKVVDGAIVSSIPILKQDKHNPIDLGDGIKLYSDCCLAETSFLPYTTKDEMIERFKTVMVRAAEYIGPEYRLLAQASHVFADADLVPMHGIDPWQIGCEGSIDAHLEALETNTPFADNLRSGSCHFHLGNAEWQNDKGGKLLTFDSRHQTVKLLDIFLGLSSIIYDKDSTSPARRKYYGRASNCRASPWGLEYRVLGNYCMRSPALMELAYDLIEHALSHVRADQELDVIGSLDFDTVRAAINECDAKAAERLLIKAKLPADLLARVKMDRGDLDLYWEWRID